MGPNIWERIGWRRLLWVVLAQNRRNSVHVLLSRCRPTSQLNPRAPESVVPCGVPCRLRCEYCNRHGCGSPRIERRLLHGKAWVDRRRELLDCQRCDRLGGDIESRFSGNSKRSGLLTSHTVYNLERNNNFSSEKAARDLGFHSRPLAETVRDTVAWLRDERYV